MQPEYFHTVRCDLRIYDNQSRVMWKDKARLFRDYYYVYVEFELRLKCVLC